MARAKVGDRAICPTCDLEVEYHGRGTWLDRGGNDVHSGTHGYDEDGIPRPIRSGKHRPPAGEVERLRAYDHQEAADARDRAQFERWKARGRPRSRNLGRTASRTARRSGRR